MQMLSFRNKAPKRRSSAVEPSKGKMERRWECEGEVSLSTWVEVSISVTQGRAVRSAWLPLARACEHGRGPVLYQAEKNSNCTPCRARGGGVYDKFSTKTIYAGERWERSSLWLRANRSSVCMAGKLWNQVSKLWGRHNEFIRNKTH